MTTQSGSDEFRSLVLLCSALSILGASFVVLSYLLFPSLRYRSITQVFFLSCCDLLVALGTMVQVSLDMTRGFNETRCSFFTVWSMFWELSGVFWTSAIALNLSLVLSRQKQRKYASWYHWVIWPAATALTLPALIQDALPGPDRFSWDCDIQGRLSGMNFAAAWFVAPVTACFLFNLATFWRGTRALASCPNSVAVRLRRRWFGYIVCFLVVWFFPGARFWLFVMGREKTPVLSNITLLVQPLHGFMDAVVYAGTNGRILARYKNLIGHWLGLESLVSDPRTAVDEKLVSFLGASLNDGGGEATRVRVRQDSAYCPPPEMPWRDSEDSGRSSEASVDYSRVSDVSFAGPGGGGGGRLSEAEAAQAEAEEWYREQLAVAPRSNSGSSVEVFRCDRCPYWFSSGAELAAHECDPRSASR